MLLTPGQSISFYEIIGPLGAGSMGEVWRARDTRLDREVALKVLPEAIAGDKDRLQRLEREAKALACLSHRNVAHVYGIDHVEGTHFIAMELVPGQDLACRLAHSPLAVADAVDVCRQVAEGLEAAHEGGLIHRDLKPANLIRTPDGTVKLLDFGLAKRNKPADGLPAGSVLTIEGSLIGTPAYMAPEQARGKAIDKRADVWAFGCVLFECLTGQRAFAGDTVSDILASVLDQEPDFSMLPPGAPAGVRTLLRRCLDKDPRTRLRDIGEARILLAEGLAAEPVARTARTGRRLLPLASGLAGAGLGALALLLGRSNPDRASSPRPIFEERLTEIHGLEESPAVSPDGGKLAFVSRVNGRRQIFLRLLARGTWKQLTNEPVDHSFPRWKDPDTLVYFRHEGVEGSGSIWETDYLATAAPQLLLRTVQGEVDVDHTGRRIAMFRTDEEGSCLVVRELGGSGAETLFRLPNSAYSSPRWSPDDRRIAFVALSGLSQTELRVLVLEEGETSRLVALGGQIRGLCWMRDGTRLIYASSRGSTLPYPPIFRLRTVGIDGSSDAPIPWQSAGYASYVEPDVTPDGKLVASRIASTSDIYRFPVGGTPLENVENALRITYQTGQVQVPSASPDGTEVAYLSDSGGHGNIWITRVDGSENPRRITHEQDAHTVIGLPIWSPRGDWITYWRGPPGVASEQWLVRPDGADRHRLTAARGGASWSPLGDALYYMAWPEDPSDTTIVRIAVDGGDPVPVRRGASFLLLSADGGTGYFTPSEYRHGEVQRASPIETGEPQLVCDLRGRIPMWPHVFALSPDDRFLATPLRDDGTTNLWLVATADGSLTKITDFEQRATTIGRQVSWSRDSRYLFAALMEADADIVVLDGALP